MHGDARGLVEGMRGVCGIKKMDIVVGTSHYDQYQHDLIDQVYDDHGPPNTILEINRRGLIDMGRLLGAAPGQSVIYRKASVTISTDIL